MLNLSNQTEKITCNHCGQIYILEESKTWWNEDGVWSHKLSKCPCCNGVNTVKFEIYHELDINNDERYYDYRRRTEYD